MTAVLWIFLVAVLAACAGAVMLTLGWRGRRVGTAPVCGGCEFDLSGLDAAGRCPECGQGLEGRGAILTGRRRRRAWAIFGGLAMGGVALSLGVSLLAAAKVEIASQPSWALIWQARLGVFSWGVSAEREAIGAELLARRRSGELTDRQLSAVIGAALEVHGDQQMEWTRGWPRMSAWSDLLGDAYALGLLSSAQRQRWAEQSVSDWQWHWSGRRLAGAELRFQMPTPDRPRLIPTGELLVVAEPTAARIDGSPVELPALQTWRGSWRVAVHFASPVSTTHTHASSDRPRSGPPVAPLPVGTHRVEIEWLVQLWLVPIGDSETRRTIDDLRGPDHTLRLERSYTVEILERAADAFETTRDPALRPALDPTAGTPRWTVSALPDGRFDVRGQLRHDVRTMKGTGEHVWFVATPHLRAAGQTARLVPWGGGAQSVMNQPHASNSFIYGVYPFDARHDQLTLVLIPDHEMAANDDRVNLLWDAPLEIPILLDWSGVPEDRLPRRAE